jgi:hypothetical protein
VKLPDQNDLKEIKCAPLQQLMGGKMRRQLKAR